MNTLDILLIVFLLIGFIIGIIRGFVRETISILIVIVAIYFSKWLMPIAKSMLVGVFSFSAEVAKPLSFVMVFVFLFVVFKLLATTLTKLAEAASMGGLNRILGGLLGAFKHAIIFSFILNLIISSLMLATIVNRKDLENSKLYNIIQPLTPILWVEFQNKVNRD